MDNVETIRRQFLKNYRERIFTADKTGVLTLELIGASFIADEPAIFGKPNEDYIEREIQWYSSCSLNVNDIPGTTPKIWKEVATPEGIINSNYGYLIYSRENGNQHEYVLRELVKNPNSRRAIMIYTRPSMHVDYNRDGMSDFVCTNTVQYVIRNGRMNAIVNMRSNDCIFGFANDRAWADHVLSDLVFDYNYTQCDHDPIRKGDIIWQVGSLHLYERHFYLLDEYKTQLNNGNCY